MSRLNVSHATPPILTHEGAPARRIPPEQQLRRLVLSTLLWEKQFYVDGVSIAAAISETIPQVEPSVVADLALEAREKYKLRHVPLLIVREMARLKTHKHLVANTLSRVIQRPDELGEYLSIYWKDKRQPISAQSKKGLATAFSKFPAYQLTKWDRKNAVKLKDVLFLTHAKPKDAEQASLWKQLISGTLTPPDTWEVTLSAGSDKKETWERLLKENQLGAIALLMNLRNMQKAGVEEDLIQKAIVSMRTERVLPFRFIAAARYAPTLEPYLEQSMVRCVAEVAKLSKTTMLLVDVSGSMDDQLSEKSDMTRIDAACGLAILCRELCQSVRIFTFSEQIVEVPARRGFALRDAIMASQPHDGTYLGKAIQRVSRMRHDRMIVFTDEQSHDAVPNPSHTGYIVNVASNTHGVGYGAWSHVDGFSEAVFDWIRENETIQ